MKGSELYLNRDISQRQSVKCLGLFIYLPISSCICLLFPLQLRALSIFRPVTSKYRMTGTENRKGREGTVVVLSQVTSQRSPGGTEESHTSTASE
jgi:hypothetical protein